jgi:hypothetical protein
VVEGSVGILLGFVPYSHQFYVTSYKIDVMLCNLFVKSIFGFSVTSNIWI